MTREEAVEVLTRLEISNFRIRSGKTYLTEALIMAINTLRTEPCGKDINVTTTDAISRQAAIDAIHYYCKNICGLSDYNWCPDCQSEQFVGLLKELPSVQPEPKWIPVSERLPEIRFNLNSRTSDTVFVCLENSTMHMAFYCDDDVWRFCESGEAKEPMLDKVIAWMPLPEPYKAESEEA